jgi:hypothetical protein
MTNNEQKLQEFAEKWRKILKGSKDPNVNEMFMAHFTALISEHYYPKEFVEWVFREGIGSNDDGTLFHYVSIQIKGHPFKETKELTFNTIDELYQYWKENVR